MKGLNTAMVCAERHAVETVVLPMRCYFADRGLLRIENIAAGMGIIFYHAGRKLAAGTHVLRAKSSDGAIVAGNPAYYADTALAYMVQHFKGQGAEAPLSVAIAGGGSMMPMTQCDVGSKIIAAVREALAGHGLSAKLEQTGGSKVRCMLLDIDAGKIKIE